MALDKLDELEQRIAELEALLRGQDNEYTTGTLNIRTSGGKRGGIKLTDQLEFTDPSGAPYPNARISVVEADPDAREGRGLKIDTDRLSVSGCVGIGTTNPGANTALSVSGGAIAVGASSITADAAIHITSSFGGFDRLLQMSPTEASKPALSLVASKDAAGNAQWWAWGVTTDHKWRMQPGTVFNGSDGLTIDKSGNVGIGTMDPQNKLQLGGNLHMDGHSIFLRLGPRDQYDVIKWNKSIDRIDIGGYAGVNLGYTAQAPNEVTPALTVANDNVGIGVTNPHHKLEVQGDIYAEGPGEFRGNLTVGGEANINSLRVNGGAVIGNFVIGTDIPDHNIPFAYESISFVNPSLNLRLRSRQSIFFHVGGLEDKNMEIDSGGRLGNMGWDPNPVHNGWGGGIHTFDIEAEGTIWCRNDILTDGKFRGKFADLAENYTSDDRLEMGDVVCGALEYDGVRRSTMPYDTRVMGVVSTEPGILLRAGDGVMKQDIYPIALCGRVPCKVTDEQGPISRGDLLTTSATPGHAMKALPITIDGHEIYSPGSIIGKALEPHHRDVGVIEVFITLS